jgi:predicted AAA+ superfamily ATPase
MFCVDGNGRFMSVDDIVKNRDAIYRQPGWVTDYHAEYWSLDYRQHRNYHFCFSPYELQCIGDYSLADADTYKRETKALVKLTSVLPCKRLLVITRDEERNIQIDDKQIEVIPIWKWILGN